MAKKTTTDYSIKANQIGCGYCDKETTCEIRDSKINKAKLGCKEFNHFLDSEKYGKKN